MIPHHQILLTCEHATNHVPAEFRPFLKNHRSLLDSHRAFDPGAFELFTRMAKKFRCPAFSFPVSRLLIEANRSKHHPALFSSVTRPLTQEIKSALLTKYYLPYRTKVENAIHALLAQKKKVLHLSIHSFTPVLNGIPRNTDVGLLYDPRRSSEKEFCKVWKKSLHAQNPGLLVRFNHPYRGIADGFTTHLRKQFQNPHYAGIELEVNQKFPLGNSASWQSLQEQIMRSLPRV